MLKFALAAAATALTLDGLNAESEDALVEDAPEDLLADQLVEEEDADSDDDDQEMEELDLDEEDDKKRKWRAKMRALKRARWFKKLGKGVFRALRKGKFSAKRLFTALKRAGIKMRLSRKKVMKKAWRALAKAGVLRSRKVRVFFSKFWARMRKFRRGRRYAKLLRKAPRWLRKRLWRNRK